MGQKDAIQNAGAKVSPAGDEVVDAQGSDYARPAAPSRGALGGQYWKRRLSGANPALLKVERDAIQASGIRNGIHSEARASQGADEEAMLYEECPIKRWGAKQDRQVKQTGHQVDQVMANSNARLVCWSTPWQAHDDSV